MKQNLQLVARNKVENEAEQIQKQRELKKLNGERQEEDNGGPQIVMMIGNGVGMFQLISSKSTIFNNHQGINLLDNRGPNEGTACRVHGKIPVLKGDGDRLMITSFSTINLPGLFGSIDNGQKGQNFSHRIERFHFGSHIFGLVTPLSGTEKLSLKGDSMYKYFIKVVPTRIHHALGTTLTYQYAVTGMQRDAHESGHTVPGISFSYEFTANVVEVYPNQL